MTDGYDVRPIATIKSANEDDGTRDALLDTINKYAGTSVDFPDGIFKKHSRAAEMIC
jgi:hypothetical protein